MTGDATLSEKTGSPQRLTLATYNVHGCVGRGGSLDPGVTAEVLRELDADVVGLQEVYATGGASSRGPSPLRALAEASGLEPYFGATLERNGFAYGNAVLTARPVHDVRRHDLSVAGCEPRGAIEVTVRAFGRSVVLFVTHLGLRSRERWRQCRRLAELIDERSADLRVLAGDVNEWNRFSRSLRVLGRKLGVSPAPRTFPARRPALALDRIWVSPRPRLVSLRVHDTPLARRASDHLPVRAVLDCSDPGKFEPRLG